MNARELMIGDWIYSKSDNKNHKVNSIIIQKDGSVLVATEDDLSFDYMFEPIPIKRIHLTKNGFKVREETDDTEFYYYDCYEINVSFDEGISEENIPPIIFLTIEFAEKSIAMPIEYVHELQQAMRVMGCDKKIEL